MRPRYVILGLLVATLAACSNPVDRARKLETSGRDFNNRLAADYRDYATYEADAFKNDDEAALFARKALDAKAGKAVPAEDPNARQIRSPDTRTELQAAHSRLTSALMGGAAARAPAAAARAQVSFDCWITQQEAGWLSHSQICRDGFITAMSRIDDVARPARGTGLPGNTVTREPANPVPRAQEDVESQTPGGGEPGAGGSGNNGNWWGGVERVPLQ